jgi:hypothetical protein
MPTIVLRLPANTAFPFGPHMDEFFKAGLPLTRETPSAGSHAFATGWLLPGRRGRGPSNPVSLDYLPKLCRLQERSTRALPLSTMH